MKQSRFDILGVGCATVDDLFYVDIYPARDTKTRARRVERQCGGLTGTALVAAAKLGAKCAYGGILGDDELFRAIEENFQVYGVDTSSAMRRTGPSPIHAVIVVSEHDGSRTIFYDGSSINTAAEAGPSAELLHSTRVLFVDNVGISSQIRSAELAHEAGIPIVADMEDDTDPFFAKLFALVDHLLLGEAFALKITGAQNAASAVRHLWDDRRKVVVVTAGDQGSWYMSSNDLHVSHQPAFPVQVVDTTGCGDVFHGAYALALARGETVDERMRFASAAAALKATKRGGQAGTPTSEAVSNLLDSII